MTDPRHQPWLERWAEGRTGFHEGRVNGWLRKYGGSLPPGRVLAPLCGKTLDLPWLVDQGFEVVGVELASRAVEDFHAEQGLSPSVADEGAFRVWRTAGLTVYQGDWFELDPKLVGSFDGVWDRAAMIALPAKERGDYVEHLLRFLRQGAHALLVTLDYEQERMDGPPYAVSEAEVQVSYGSNCTIRKLESCDALDGNPRFVESGLERVQEEVFLLERA